MTIPENGTCVIIRAATIIAPKPKYGNGLMPAVLNFKSGVDTIVKVPDKAYRRREFTWQEYFRSITGRKGRDKMIQAALIAILRSMVFGFMVLSFSTISYSIQSPDSQTASPDSAGQTTENQVMLHGKDLRELIELNDPVKASMVEWLTWLRPQLMDSYVNYCYLRDKIAPIYEEADLPEALLFAIIATETGGKVHAVSKAGAVGLMQFMRETGKLYGLIEKDGFDMRLDPVEATKANVAFMNEQLKTLNDNLEKALAAYNGGPVRISRLDRKLKGIDFWDSRFYNSLPGETRQYVPRLLAAAWLFLHPQDYGLQFEGFPDKTSNLTLKRDSSLDQLSICLGQAQKQRNGWFRTLRNLNPQLEYNDPIKAGETIVIPTILAEDYERKCLEGDLVERAHELHKAQFPQIIQYTVVRGDSIGKIANRFHCSVEELAVLNNLKGPQYLIRIGRILKIPGNR
jgi:membrane-bound lytic murein transglycosylase D